jgi:hypothetical protein
MMEGSGSGSVPLTDGSGFREAQKYRGPTDPDPDIVYKNLQNNYLHWPFKGIKINTRAYL